MSTRWLEAKVLDNRHWTDTLFSLRVEGPGLQFEAGQFVRLALDIDGERIARPFSFVNPPADPVHEFYGIVVPGGALSPTLARLQPGGPLYLAPNPAAVRDGRLEQAAGLKIAPESSQVLLCGNPDMLKDATAALVERGLRKHRRRNPGQISVESFW